MKITREQQNTLLTKLELINDDCAQIFTQVEGGEFDARAMGEIADKIVDWATQLSESLYEIQISGDSTDE